MAFARREGKKKTRRSILKYKKTANNSKVRIKKKSKAEKLERACRRTKRRQNIGEKISKQTKPAEKW